MNSEKIYQLWLNHQNMTESGLFINSKFLDYFLPKPLKNRYRDSLRLVEAAVAGTGLEPEQQLRQTVIAGQSREAVFIKVFLRTGFLITFYLFPWVHKMYKQAYNFALPYFSAYSVSLNNRKKWRNFGKCFFQMMYWYFFKLFFIIIFLCYAKTFLRLIRKEWG